MYAGKLAILGFLFLFSGCVLFPQEAKPTRVDAIAVWQHQGENWDIWYSLWDQDAKKWHTPDGGASSPIIRDTGDDHDPDITSNDRTAIAVWNKATGGNTIYYSVWNGKWSAPARLSSGDRDKDPAIAMEPSGNALAVWVSGLDSLMYSYYQSGSWSAPRAVPMRMSNVSLPELTFNTREGLYYLIFTGNNGTINGAYAAGYGASGWSGAELLMNDSILDNDVPTGHRTGIDSAESRNEVTAVWPGSGGKLYSAKVLGKSAIELDRGAMPDVAYDSQDSASGTYKKEGTVIFKKDVQSPGGATSLSSLTGNDERASLTFVKERTVPLVVWWNRVIPPAQIFYSYFEEGKWFGPEPIDPALEGTMNRNPSVADMGHRQSAFSEPPSCGNGVFEFPWEQCESGKACPDQRFFCKNCNCQEKPIFRIGCAANTLDSSSKGINEYDPEQFLCRDDCSEIEPGLACDAASCTCKRVFPEPPTNKSCVLNSVAVETGGGNPFSNATMFCRDDCKIADISLICDPASCICKQSLPPAPGEPASHLECVNNACVRVSGAGADGCASNSQCESQAPPPSVPPSPPPSSPPPAPQQICGNHQREGSEQCDGVDDSACGPGYCTPMCSCY